jgi:lipoic acid synthetase
VVTSVDRDDLPDARAQHFVNTIHAIRKSNPTTRVEVLIPDFGGDWAALQKVLEARPEVLNHNTETVPSLYRRVRSKGVYERCLEVLERSARFRDEHFPTMLVKTGLMVGLGESVEELLSTFQELRDRGTDILTIGQYMRPTMKHLPVERFSPPEEFDELGRFRFVEFRPAGALLITPNATTFELQPRVSGSTPSSRSLVSRISRCRRSCSARWCSSSARWCSA